MSIFSGAGYLSCDFILQLPYINADGNPVVVDITPHDARRLVELGTHKALKVGSLLYTITPVKPAEVGVEFQRGQPRV